MKIKLQQELDQRNSELAFEEKRLNEINQKFSLLKQSNSPAMILKMHDDLKKESQSREF